MIISNHVMIISLFFNIHFLLEVEKPSITVKPVLSGYSKIDKNKVLKPCGSLMQFKTIAECSMGAFCNTFDLY